MKKLIKENLRKEKNGSGIYRIYNRNRRLAYIGRASNGNIKHHLVQHFGSKKYSGAKFGTRAGYYYKIKLMPKHKVKLAEKRVAKRVKPAKNKYLYLKGRSRRKGGE